MGLGLCLLPKLRVVLCRDPTSPHEQVEVLDEAGAWICIHCGAMRHQGRLCDIPWEVKRILRAIHGVELIDEVTSRLLPPQP